MWTWNWISCDIDAWSLEIYRYLSKLIELGALLWETFSLRLSVFVSSLAYPHSIENGRISAWGWEIFSKFSRRFKTFTPPYFMIITPSNALDRYVKRIVKTNYWNIVPQISYFILLSKHSYNPRYDVPRTHRSSQEFISSLPECLAFEMYLPYWFSPILSSSSLKVVSSSGSQPFVVPATDSFLEPKAVLMIIIIIIEILAYLCLSG